MIEMLAEALGQVLGAFDLAQPDVLEVLDSASANRSFRLSIGPHRYVARCWQSAMRQPRLRFLSRCQQTLRAAGAPVPRLLTTVARAPALWHAQRWWQVFEWVEGQPFSFTNQRHLAEAAAWLCYLHQHGGRLSPGAAEGYALPIADWWTRPDVLLDAARLACAAAPQQPVVWERFAAYARLARELLPRRTLTTLPLAWTHGDFHGLNLAYRDDQLVGVFDFELADVRPRAYDVAYALLMLARPRRGTYVIQPERAACFLEHYQAGGTALSQPEHAALPALMIVAHLPDHTYLSALARHKGPAAVDQAIRYWLTVLDATCADLHLLMP